MNTKATTLSLLVSMLFLVGCSSEHTDVEIRLRNMSTVTFNDVRVNTSEDHEYGNLAPAETSAYQIHVSAYRYAFVEVEIDGTIYTIQPIDFIGETPLDPGKYTYEIGASDDLNRFGRLSIDLVHD